MWSILENVSCTYEYSAGLEWNALKISVKHIWFSVSFKAAISQLIFCLEDPVYWCQWCLKILYSDCIAVSLSLHVHQDLLYIFGYSYDGCIKVYTGYILLSDCSLYFHSVSFFASYYSFCFKVYFFRYKYCYHSLFSFPFDGVSFLILLLLVCVYLSLPFW